MSIIHFSQARHYFFALYLKSCYPFTKPPSPYHSANQRRLYFPISKIPIYRGIGIRVPRLSAGQPNRLLGQRCYFLSSRLSCLPRQSVGRGAESKGSFSSYQTRHYTSSLSGVHCQVVNQAGGAESCRHRYQHPAGDAANVLERLSVNDAYIINAA